MSINRSPSCDCCRLLDEARNCMHPDRGDDTNDRFTVQQVEISKVLGGNWDICSGFNVRKSNDRKHE